MPSEKVTVKANGENKHITLPCSLLEFLTFSGWKATQVVVEYNGSVLPRNRLRDVQLKEGDQLEVIVPVAGG